MEKNKKNNEQNIPEMKIKENYSNKKPIISQNNNISKEVEKKKKELEKLKSFITKKYPFTRALSILPPQSLKDFIEEEIGEDMPEKELEKLKNKTHLFMIISEEKFKEISKIKKEIVEKIDEEKQNIWIHIKTPADIWEICLDSKFEIVSAIAMSFPLHDRGILEALRVAEIHKSLVLQKFEKYVVSYVIGGSLVRGEAIKTSDIDVFVIINDTDVKRMPRLELKERLRGIIYQYIAEAEALAGLKKKNILNVQVYLLTDFWESVKDANPVMFTFIRDGIPIYDRGTFMPWKALLKMGKLKPSPEAIDMFMSMGDKTVQRAKISLLDIVIHEIYWSLVTPSQALLMLNGSPPPTPKYLVNEMEKIFVNKEKMLEKRYINILKEVVEIYKNYEHEKIKEIKGVKVDKIIKNTEDYLKRLKELREQIEKRYEEKTIEQLYKDVFELLKTIVKAKSQSAIIEEFEKDFVKKGKFSPQNLRILRDIIKAKTQFKKGKLNSHLVNEARKNASILINDLIEYNQRCELAEKNNKK
jgi:uncharacterized protein (UPF0332 family)/predicted nucleotidyltransferase